MLSFAYKRFDGVVPAPGDLDEEDRTLLEKVEAGFETVGGLYDACKFRAASGEALALAREANGYTFAPLSAGLDRKAPWFQIKRIQRQPRPQWEYEEETRSHQALTYDHSGAIGTWAKSELPPGQALRQPTPLFKKLDESVVEEEYARLEG